MDNTTRVITLLATARGDICSPEQLIRRVGRREDEEYNTLPGRTGMEGHLLIRLSMIRCGMSDNARVSSLYFQLGVGRCWRSSDLGSV